MIHVLLAEGVRMSAEGPDSVAVENGPRRMRLKGLSSPLVELLQRLGAGPLGWESCRGLLTIMPRLAERGLIRFQCVADGHPLLTAVPAGGLSQVGFGLTAGSQPVRLSRFAFLRRAGDSIVIESPVQMVRVVVCDARVIGLVAGLATARTVQDAAQGATLPPDQLGECVRFLLGTGVLGVVGQRGLLEEELRPELAMRECHDLVLHNRSRSGLTDQPLGAQFPFADVMLPEPAVKPAMAPDVIPLPEPSPGELTGHDMPLAQAMERRRSVRRYGQHPVTLAQLGEFLYRVARVRSIRPGPADDPQGYETTDRPYPSGGAMYDLEIYLTVRSCSGLAAGVYHYEPVGHALARICQRQNLIDEMVGHARAASGFVDVPQVVLTLASRFGRLGWKYQGICYSITLKNVGVLYEAMYLVATAMGLAPCALGGGNAALFSRITGIDPLVESSVGDFMLGSLPGLPRASASG